MKTNQELKNAALAALKGNWWPAVLAAFVYMAIACLAELSYYGAVVLLIFVAFPLAIGFAYTFLKLLNESDSNLTGNMFNIGFNDYWHHVGVYLLYVIKVFLWTLLLIVPGIIKSFSYAMTPYIVIDHPEYTASEAIAASESMMKGNKWRLFVLELSFIGWGLLAILTCGIGFLWLTPYMQTTLAAFYNDVKPAEVTAATV